MEIGTDTTARIAAATLGDRITSRLSAGLSAAELARFVGVTSEAVSQWESGETEGLKPENLVQTAEFLATTERWLTRLSRFEGYEDTKYLILFITTSVGLHYTVAGGVIPAVVIFGGGWAGSSSASFCMSSFSSGSGWV